MGIQRVAPIEVRVEDSIKPTLSLSQELMSFFKKMRHEEQQFSWKAIKRHFHSCYRGLEGAE
jgi:hypothetical protein